MIISDRVLPRLVELQSFAAFDAGFADMDAISIGLELKLAFYGTPFIQAHHGSIWFEPLSFKRISEWSDLADMLLVTAFDT